MKTPILFRNISLRIFGLILTSILALQPAISQAWFNSNWSHRSPVAISNPGSTILTDFQVEISLSSANFDFAKVLADGSDIRLTASDGITPIQFWIESWNYGTSAVIWVKVPGIPITGTNVYVYFGNPSPEITPADPVETPPIGPYSKYVGNPISVPGLCTNNVLPENLVYEAGTYYLIVSNRCVTPAALSIVSSTDLVTWVNEGIILSATITGDPGRYFDAPCLVKADGTWYIFYSSYYGTWSESNPAPIGIARSTTGTLMGPYEELNRTLLTCGAIDTWDDARVSEPHVIQRDNGDWVIVYMGDAAASGGFVEQVGIAVSSTGIEGPYIKSGGNPVIPFGLAGSLDAGTVADPWVIKYDDTYYIGYTASPTKSGWNTTYVTTTDWVNFPKSNTVILNQGPAGSWDATSAFRGAVTRVGDTYLFPYTGQGSGGFQFGIASQPAFMSPPNAVNNVYEVFEFYDGFDSIALNTSKWSIYRQGVQTGESEVENGILTLRANSNASTDVITLTGNKLFGPGMLLEVSAMHPDADGSGTTASEVGFGNAIRTDVVRIFDYNSSTNFIKQSLSNSQGNVFDNLMSFGLNSTDFLLHRIFLNSTTRVDFALENTEFEPITEHIPTIALPPWLMCAALPNQATLMVDWVRVRKFTGVEPVVTLYDEVGLNTQWTGAVDRDWAKPGNWTAGVPSDWTNTVIQPASNIPLLNSSFSVSVDGSLSILPGAGLTINGNLVNNGQLTISSTLASSGSLIVTGTSTGSITYNRQLKSGSVAESDYHLVAPPVGSNTELNTGKISSVNRWSELTGTWTTLGITSVLPGQAYNIRQEAASDGVIAFTGPIVGSNITVGASSPYADAIAPGDSYFDRTYAAGRNLTNLGGRGWNLLGNPYPSAISVDAFIAANYNATPSLSQFDPNYVALYLFDGTERRYYYLASGTGWPSGLKLNETHVQAGQGFFVLAMNDNSEFTFTRAMQEHSTATAMLKSGAVDNRWPGLQLKVVHPAGEVITTVVYNENMTEGVDPGYDIGLFKSGQDIEIYTTLALNDNGLNYTRQALPSGSAETLRIPVGIDYQTGGEVTFSATTVPLGGRRFWLEDRTAGIFTDLSLKSYTVTLPANSYGPGRFYLLASANTPTGTEQLPDELADLRIWVSSGRLIIKGAVSEGALCEIYDMNGRMLHKWALNDGALNTADLPSGFSGVVLIRVTDGVKITTRKVAIP